MLIINPAPRQIDILKNKFWLQRNNTMHKDNGFNRKIFPVESQQLAFASILKPVSSFKFLGFTNSVSLEPLNQNIKFGSHFISLYAEIADIYILHRSSLFKNEYKLNIYTPYEGYNLEVYESILQRTVNNIRPDQLLIDFLNLTICGINTEFMMLLHDKLKRTVSDYSFESV